jgi:hypothetical protein
MKPGGKVSPLVGALTACSTVGVGARQLARAIGRGTFRALQSHYPSGPPNYGEVVKQV